MSIYKFVIFVISISIAACAKHDPLPDLEPIPPIPPIVYPYSGNVMVYLDSTRITPFGASYSLKVYVSINDSVLALYATKYTRINVYDGNTQYGVLNYPGKSFGKLAMSGEIYRYHFTMIDTTGKPSISSPIYTVTIP